MAITTAERRASALNFGSGDLLPVPDGTIEQRDRQTLIDLYSAIQAAADTDPTLNAADIDLIFDELVTDNLTFRQVLQFIPHMDALLRQNKMDHIAITSLLNELKTLIIPLKGAIQDSDRNQLRGRGPNNASRN